MMYLASSATPFKRRMSCGLSGPSATTSPRSTRSPSKTESWRSSGMSAGSVPATLLPSSLMISKRRLLRVSLPKLTVPVASAKMAGSFSLRASNRSATRGRPPTMSAAFDPSWGMRAMTSPLCTSWPSSKLSIALPGSGYSASRSPTRRTGWPSASTRRTAGRRSCPAGGRSWASIKVMLVSPVISSICRLMERPSSMSLKTTRPSTSVMMGWVCGSHCAMTWPDSTAVPSRTLSTVP